MLGHYDAGFTLRTYTHATRQMQQKAAKKMGSFMAQVMWAEKRRKNTGEKAKASSPVLFHPFRAFPRVGHGVGQSFFPYTIGNMLHEIGQ